MSGVYAAFGELVLRDPACLWAALLVPLALLWRRRRAPPVLSFAPLALFPSDAAREARLPASLRARLVGLPLALSVLGLLLLIVALAGPVARVRTTAPHEGIDILLCLDTSSSMRQQDLDRRRSRLAVALDGAAAFIAGRPDDRIGLIRFARFPDVRCPLTLDHDALTRMLSEVETVSSDGPEDATGIGTAVARAAQVLDSSGARSRVVILLTDGAENVALEGAADEIPPAHAAQLCARLGVRVYAIVVGGGPAGGLDTRPVEDLTRRTGGVFQRARDARAVEHVYAEIDALERSSAAEPRFLLADRYRPFLLLGLLLLLLGRTLAATILQVLP